MNTIKNNILQDKYTYEELENLASRFSAATQIEGLKVIPDYVNSCRDMARVCLQLARIKREKT